MRYSLLSCGFLWSVVASACLEPPSLRWHEIADSFSYDGSGEVEVALFDADGTLRLTSTDAPTPSHPDEVRLLPGVAEKIREENRHGRLVAVLSNQGGIGLYSKTLGRVFTADDALRCMQRLVDLLAEQGAIVHYVDYGGGLAPHAPDRKPNLGMFHRLERVISDRFQARLNRDTAFMVGDFADAERDPFDTDYAFAVNAGIGFIEINEYAGWRVRRIRTMAELRAYNRR